MEFYDLLAEYYDLLFPPDTAVCAFLRDRFQDGRHLVDVGGGTGNYAVALSREGFRVTLLEPSAAMTERAQCKVAALPDQERARLGVMTAGFEQINALRPAQVHGVYCIGNTLAHLTEATAIREAIADTASLLPPGGVVLIQVLNFDRIPHAEPFELPTLTGAGGQVSATMRRRYLPASDPALVRFAVELEIRSAAGGVGAGDTHLLEREAHETVLRRIPSAFLSATLEEEGFTLSGFYGGFDGTPFDPEWSFVLIVEAVRAGRG